MIVYTQKKELDGGSITDTHTVNTLIGGIIQIVFAVMEKGRTMADMCGDNRFEIIEKAKNDLVESTNISTSPDEMAVIDNILFRCWQMGWLKDYERRTDGVDS